MKVVEPIREKHWRDEFVRHFEENSERNLVLFLMGIYTGFRISDILSLRVRDVQNKTHLSIVEKKTNKPRKVLIHEKLKKHLNRYIAGMARTDYLFLSRQKNKYGKYKAIERSTVDKILKKAAKQIGYKEAIATHSMRKTFGYMYYQKTNDVGSLQKFFNHESQEVTLRYIGLQQDSFDKNITLL